MDLTQAVKSRAKALGFSAVGITSADPFAEAEAAATQRTADGLMDGLTWWSEARVHASADPQRSTPEARTVIALAYPYPAANSPSSIAEFPSATGAFPSPSGEGQGGGLALVEELNRLGGLHGVGRIDMIEDRFVGIKSREIYEAPAAVILHAAHRALEDMVLDAEVGRFKASVASEYARLVYQGKWFTSHRRDLDAYVHSTQSAVSGTVRVKLHKGSAQVIGRSSPYSLYRPRLATYSAGDQFDHQAAVGFIKLVGLPVRTQAEVQGSAVTEPLLEDDRHVVEVGPGALEVGLAEPVLRSAVPGVVDPNLRR